MHNILILALLFINQVCLAIESNKELKTAEQERVVSEEEIFQNDKHIASIQVLNKITAKSQYLDIPINSSVTIGTLTITVNACWQASPYDLTENKILLYVAEKKTGHQDSEVIFNGWMFSSSPGISSLEHAVYDITAINCYDQTK